MELLSTIHLKRPLKILKHEYKKLKSRKLFNRLEVMKGFINNNISLSAIVINILLVLPAKLRPVLFSNNKIHISSDLNALYEHILVLNNIPSEHKMMENNNKIDFNKYINKLKALQQAVDKLIDSYSNVDKFTGYDTKPFKIT